MPDNCNTGTVHLSIIIPHYNLPDTLRNLLKSIGVYDDIEVIVVDDKSTVEWKYLAGEFPYVRFLENTSEKKGPGTARNIGLDNASGEWILFADSDDILVDGWKQTVTENFCSEHDIVFFPPESIDSRTGEKNTRRGRWYYSLCQNYIKTGDDEILRVKYSSPCSKLMRRTLIEENHLRFDEIMHWEDTMFSAKIGYYAKSVTAKLTPIYLIIDHDGSMTTIDTQEAYRIRMDVFCEQYCFWKEKPGFKNSLKILKKDAYIMLVNGLQFGRSYVAKRVRDMRNAGVPVSCFGVLIYFVKQRMRKILKVFK